MSKWDTVRWKGGSVGLVKLAIVFLMQLLLPFTTFIFQKGQHLKHCTALYQFLTIFQSGIKYIKNHHEKTNILGFGDIHFLAIRHINKTVFRIIFASVIFSTFQLMSAQDSLKISWKSNLWKLNLCTAENVRQFLLYRDSLIGGEDSCPMGQDHDIAFPNPGNLQNRKIKGQNQMGLYFFTTFYLVL